MSAKFVMRKPPRKRPGQGLGRRAINGAILDVPHGAEWFGSTDKTLRSWVERRIVPFRRLGGRIVFVRTELERFLECLDGVKLDEALSNLRIRTGGSADDGATTGTPLVVPKGKS